MKRFIATLIALVFALGAPVAALALDIGEAKQKGLVGETDSGYIAATGGNVSDDVKKLVSTINAKRKQAYEKAAKQNGVPLTEVEKLGAKQAIENTPSGQQVRVGGAWKTK